MLKLLILKYTTWKATKDGCWKNSDMKRTWISCKSDSSLKFVWWLHDVPRCKRIHLSFNQHPLSTDKMLMMPTSEFALSTYKILRMPTGKFANVKTTHCGLLKTAHCCFCFWTPTSKFVNARLPTGYLMLMMAKNVDRPLAD